MTKYKQLHRAVQHLTHYQINARIARRVAEYRAATRDRKNAARRIRNEQIPNRRIAGIAPLRARPTLSPRWMAPQHPLPAPMADAAGLPPRWR
jgi:anti-sigma factor RsiW